MTEQVWKEWIDDLIESMCHEPLYIFHDCDDIDAEALKEYLLGHPPEELE